MLDDLSPWAHVGVFAAAAVAVWLAGTHLARCERRDRTVGRMGVDSWVVLGCYAAGIGALYTLR